MTMKPVTNNELKRMRVAANLRCVADVIQDEARLLAKEQLRYHVACEAERKRAAHSSQRPRYDLINEPPIRTATTAAGVLDLIARALGDTAAPPCSGSEFSASDHVHENWPKIA